jgi:hypothetical protein
MTLMTSQSLRTAVISAVLVLLAGGPVGAADLRPEEVPLFKLRAKVASVAGHVSAGTDRKVHFDLSGVAFDSAADQWSNWVKFDKPQAAANLKGYPAIYLHGWPIVVHLQIASGVVYPTAIDAELKFDETADPVALHGDLFGPTLGIIVWRDEQKKPHAATMATYNQRYWKQFADVQIPADRRAKHFPIVDRFIGADDDRINWREGIDHLAGAGMTGIMLPPSRQTRDLLAAAGLNRTAWAVYNPPGYAFDYDAEATSTKVEVWAQSQGKSYLDAGYAPRDMALFSMSDEPGWYYPEMYQKLRANAAGMARFRDYVKSQGLEPRDLGKASWNDVGPIGRSAAVDLPSRRLYYWTQRFFPWDSARHFAGATKSLEKAFYSGLPVLTNWNNFAGRLYVPGPAANNGAKHDPDAGMGTHDWFEYAKMRGTTMLWTEDWFSDAEAYQWSFFCSKMRSAAERGGIAFGGYVVPRTAGDRKDGILQKILSVVGHGGKAVEYFVFGPEYAFPGNCYSENAGLLTKMAEAHALIAKAEPMLWPGLAPRSRVAILAPRSAQMWDDLHASVAMQIEDAANNHLNRDTVDYMAEVFDLFLALQHANIPTDFIPEDDLTAAGLKPYRVVYITEPNVPAENQKSLVEWMRVGGTVVTVSGAAARDRFDQPCDVLERAIGTVEQPRERLLVADVASLKSIGTGNGVCGPFTAIGARGKLSSDGADGIARFDDGSPAVVRRTIGLGHAFCYGWLPGISYFRSSTKTQDKLPVGFSESMRRWITLPVEFAKVEMPVRLDAPLVESPVLLSSGGAAITLLNWTGAPIAELKADARLPFAVRSVQSVRSGTIPFQRAGDHVMFAVPLEAADIIMVQP